MVCCRRRAEIAELMASFQLPEHLPRLQEISRVSVCVCAREREGEREKEGGGREMRGREGGSESERERVTVSCVYIYISFDMACTVLWQLCDSIQCH